MPILRHASDLVPFSQHPTRKIYMLEGIEPSVALTGGPWYTDNELDVAFINTLIRACLKIVRDMVRWTLLLMGLFK